MIERETIGPPECPLFYRWTLLAPRFRRRVAFKVMVHRFIPNRQDADVPHDHPRPFITFVLRGGYDDLVRCPACGGSQRVDDPALLHLVGTVAVSRDYWTGDPHRQPRRVDPGRNGAGAPPLGFLEARALVGLP